MGISRKPRQCQRCGHNNAPAERACTHCMTPLVRPAWRMTQSRVRFVHVLALQQKGLTDEFYRLRLNAVGVASCKELKRAQYAQFVRGLKGLPNAPGWRARK